MKNNRTVVLLLGGGRRVSLAKQLKRSAERLGKQLHIVSYELRKEVPIAVEGEVIEGLDWDDPHVINDVLRVAIEHEADIILPIADGSISVAAACALRLEHVFVPLKDVELAETLYDRALSAEAFKKAGIPIPATYSVINVEPPVIAKPRRGSTARTIRIFKDLGELMELSNLDSFFLQEFIADFDEYAVNCYVSQKGELLYTVPVKLLEVRGGIITRAITEQIPELEKLAGKVIKSFELRGPVTIEVLFDRKRHRYVVTHVAPRPGDCVECAVYAGAPLCDNILKEADDVPVALVDDWADNTLMAAYTEESIFFKK